MTSPESPGQPDAGRPQPDGHPTEGADDSGAPGGDAPLNFRQRIAMALMIATPFALVGVIYLVLR